MTRTKEQQIAALLRVLRPAPAAWVTAASEIPRLERDLDNPPEGPGATEPAPSPDPNDELSPRSVDR